MYVGCDLHKEKHVAVMLSTSGEKLGEIEFVNRPSEFPELMEKIFKHKKKHWKIAFGLEDVGGFGRCLAQFLVDKKQIVKEVNSALTRMRRNSFPTTRKDDSWDAQCVATVLKDNFDDLPDAKPMDIYFCLQQLVGRRNALTRQGSRLKQNLHQQLSYHYPSYRKFFSDLSGKSALNFFEKYPSPKYLIEIDEIRLGEELKEWSNNFLGSNKAREILEYVKRDGDTILDFQGFRDFTVVSLIREIKFKESELIKIDAKLKELIDMFDYKLTSVQGIDIVSAAGIIAEVGDISRFKSADKLARYAGVAPVPFSSGKKINMCISKQGNRVLNNILYMLALRHIIVSKDLKKPNNPMMREYYDKKISEGMSEKSALVRVQRKLVNLIYSMMKNKTEYVKPDGTSGKFMKREEGKDCLKVEYGTDGIAV